LETCQRKGVGGTQAFPPFPGHSNPQVAVTDRELFEHLDGTAVPSASKNLSQRSTWAASPRWTTTGCG